jgi:TPP-dependent indolepyruvate ferredoxin oxidoreductase alpha subunit
MSPAKPKSYLATVEEIVDNICTGCPKCSDRDTCEANFDEDLAFEAAPDEEAAASLKPGRFSAKA